MVPVQDQSLKEKSKGRVLQALKFTIFQFYKRRREIFLSFSLSLSLSLSLSRQKQRERERERERETLAVSQTFRAPGFTFNNRVLLAAIVLLNKKARVFETPCSIKRLLEELCCWLPCFVQECRYIVHV